MLFFLLQHEHSVRSAQASHSMETHRGWRHGADVTRDDAPRLLQQQKIFGGFAQPAHIICAANFPLAFYSLDLLLSDALLRSGQDATSFLHMHYLMTASMLLRDYRFGGGLSVFLPVRLQENFITAQARWGVITSAR